MMLQLNPTIDVKTSKGDAEAFIIIDYGVNVNTVWLCRMKGGIVKHFYSDEIQIYGNPMNGEGWDISEPKEATPTLAEVSGCKNCGAKRILYGAEELCGECFTKKYTASLPES
jgi:hypothetical protein